MSRRKRGRANPPQQPTSSPLPHEACAPAAEQPSLELIDAALPEPCADERRAADGIVALSEAPVAAAHLEGDKPEAAGAEQPVAAGCVVVPAPAPMAASTLGRRFTEARNALGFTLEDTARRLRVPAAVIYEIEAGRIEALGAPIYARGYLRSYARLVAIPEAALTSVLAELPLAQPELQPALNAPARRPLAPRLATPALYALLTLLLVAPIAVQLYQRSSAPAPQPALQRLDAAGAQAQPPGGTATATPETLARADAAADGHAATVAEDDHAASALPSTQRPVPPAVARADDPAAVAGAAAGKGAADASASKEPVMASLAPMPASTAPAPAAAGQRVVLRLTEASWVELIGADGSRIEYSMLPAGTAREYQVAGKASLRIGNVRGATLAIDGRELDLAPFSRSNVARVALGEGAPVPGSNQ